MDLLVVVAVVYFEALTLGTTELLKAIKDNNSRPREGKINFKKTHLTNIFNKASE